MACIVKYKNKEFNMDDIIQEMSSKFINTNLNINLKSDSNEYGDIVPVQKQGTNEEMLLNEQSELGLREVGKGDQKSEEIAKESQEKENPLNLDMTKLDPKNPAGILETIKTKLQTDGILRFEDENGNKKENC